MTLRIRDGGKPGWPTMATGPILKPHDETVQHAPMARCVCGDTYVRHQRWGSGPLATACASAGCTCAYFELDVDR